MGAPPRPEPPAGTVTFLFTDIEGSTRLLAALGDGYDELLDQHDDLLRAAWRRNGGYEINTGGDAFYLAFSSADAAIRAAIDGQRALAGARWPADVELRVRMGIHTGYARPRRGDYSALAVNQTARVIGAAHGGQIILSPDSVDALAEDPPLGLAALGRFRVRDFDSPVVLHRVEAEGWNDPGRPPRVQPADGHNLVRPVTSLVGRESECEWLVQHVHPGGLVTLVGPGGVGKTRLAVEAGLVVSADWPDGVWLVDLVPVRTGDHIAEAVSEVVGAAHVPGIPPLDEVREHLQTREALLILDNCEHLVRDVARMVHDLMSACPRLGVLATSRTPLGLRSETARRLGPLPVDDERAGAVRLFLDRAAHADDVDLPAVRALCRHLEGLPLALELAASRTTALSPALILAGIEAAPGALRGADPTLPDRHQSLDLVLDWSWGLLEEPARAVLRRLSVFAGSFDLEHAGLVGAGGAVSDDAVPELLWRLLDHSLVLQDRASGSTRFRLAVPVRAFVADRLPSDERERTLRALAAWYMAELGPDVIIERAGLAAMDGELDNVRGIVGDLIGTDDATAQALGWSIGRYHLAKAAHATAAAEVTELLDRTGSSPNRVGLLTLAADLYLAMGQHDAAGSVLELAERASAAMGHPAWDRVGLRKSQGMWATRRGDHDAARRIAELAVRESVTARDLARAWDLVGIERAICGDALGAIDGYERSLAASDAAGLWVYSLNAHSNLAESNLQLGRREQAAHHQLVALRGAREQGDVVGIAFAVMVAACLLQQDGGSDRAVSMHTCASGALETVGFVLYEHDADNARVMLEGARAQLGDDLFARAQAAATELTLAEAADEAEEVLDAVSASSSSQRSGADLTVSEAGR